VVGHQPRTAGYRFERNAWRAGLVRVAGVDEAGRGPLAGPVVAAAVILHPWRAIKGIQDSKLLSPDRRADLFARILEDATAVGIGEADPGTIDRLNILEATRSAMLEAIGKLPVPPELVLIDAVRLPGLAYPQKNLVHGDRRSASIAAASIVAKVTRDRLMVELAKEFPHYELEINKGYATEKHYNHLFSFGASRAHRRSFNLTRQLNLFGVE